MGVFSYLPHHLDLASEDSVGHSPCMSGLARRRAIMGSIVQPKRSCLGAATGTSTAVRFVWRIPPLLGVCGRVNHLHLSFGCFPSIPLLFRRRAVLARQEHGLTILLGILLGERGARTTTSSLNSIFVRSGIHSQIRDQWFFAILEAMTTD